MIELIKYSKALMLMSTLFFVFGVFLIVTGRGYFPLVWGDNVGFMMFIPALLSLVAARMNASARIAQANSTATSRTR